MAGPRNNKPRADPLKNSLSTCLTVRENKHALHMPACCDWGRQSIGQSTSHSCLLPPTVVTPQTAPHPDEHRIEGTRGTRYWGRKSKGHVPIQFFFSLHHTEYLPAPKLSTQFLAGDKMINLVLTTIFQGEKACNSGKAFFPTKLWNMREIKEVKMLYDL